MLVDAMYNLWMIGEPAATTLNLREVYGLGKIIFCPCPRTYPSLSSLPSPAVRPRAP